jgi:hypothetical protein
MVLDETKALLHGLDLSLFAERKISACATVSPNGVGLPSELNERILRDRSGSSWSCRASNVWVIVEVCARSSTRQLRTYSTSKSCRLLHAGRTGRTLIAQVLTGRVLCRWHWRSCVRSCIRTLVLHPSGHEARLLAFR